MKSNFTIRRRSKIISQELPLIFGISGFARCGKDTLAKYITAKLERMTLPCVTMSFAQSMKLMLDPFLIENFNISAFTNDSEEKKLIRPVMVAVGTDVARKIDPDFWVKRLEPKVQSCLDSKIITIIPDVRYKNEADWIKSKGGFLIHITKIGLRPPNMEERANNPVIKKLADHHIRWKHFTDEKETCEYHVNKLFYNQGWTTYGKFK